MSISINLWERPAIPRPLSRHDAIQEGDFSVEPARGAINHLKITGGVGIFHKESAAVPSVNTTPPGPILVGSHFWEGDLRYDFSGRSCAGRFPFADPITTPPRFSQLSLTPNSTA